MDGRGAQRFSRENNSPDGKSSVLPHSKERDARAREGRAVSALDHVAPLSVPPLQGRKSSGGDAAPPTPPRTEGRKARKAQGRIHTE